MSEHTPLTEEEVEEAVRETWGWGHDEAETVARILVPVFERVTHAHIAIVDAQRSETCLVQNHDALAARLADAEARAEAAEAKVARVEALADEWAESVEIGHRANPRGHYALSTHERDLDELREALRGDQ